MYNRQLLKRAMSFIKDLFETLAHVATVAGIVLGGYWTWKIFVKERSDLPHVNIEQKVSHAALSKDVTLLRVVAEVANAGSARLLIDKAQVRVQQILPVASCRHAEPCALHEFNDAISARTHKTDRFSWPVVAERVASFKHPMDVEPNERAFADFEFAIPSSVRLVRVYTYFNNEAKSPKSQGKPGEVEVGWALSTLYDFPQPSKEGAK